VKSSPNNRLNAIITALREAHEEAQRCSDSSLHRMPEYFMATRVADYFATHFINFGYRLEAQVKRTFENADLWHQDVELLLNDPEVRSNGRFDLVLRTGKQGRPAHILEFKRGSKVEPLLKDVRRLAKICEHAGSHRLKTNYLVFTRRCALEGSVESLDEHPFHAALSGFDGVSCQLYCSEPMQPLLDRNYNVVEGGAFDIVVVEIKAAE
jgi:hypothetical protein